MQSATGKGALLKTIGRIAVIASNLPMTQNASLATRAQKT
jgi:hypothetical protein